jgi:hypothetical protein
MQYIWTVAIPVYNVITNFYHETILARSDALGTAGGSGHRDDSIVYVLTTGGLSHANIRKVATPSGEWVAKSVQPSSIVRHRE